MIDHDKSRPRTWSDLQELSDDELVKLHDETRNDWVDFQYYLEEIRYRRQGELTRVMLRLTRRMLCLTIVIAILTVVVTVATVYNAVQDDPPAAQVAPQ